MAGCGAARGIHLSGRVGGRLYLLIWLVLMKSHPAGKLSAFCFITPLFGAAAGHFVLHERCRRGCGRRRA